MTLPYSPTDPDQESTRDDGRSAGKSRKGRIALLVIAAIVVVAAVVAGGYLWNLASTFNSGSQKIESAFPAESARPQKAEAPAGQKAPVNILIMGSDSRGATEVDAVQGGATDQRADTLMLMHIPADRKNVYTMSIMRDLWVPIPGQREAKINAALALGGVPLMVQTVESIFNQRIDHVAMVDFEGFKDLTNALGGVQVNVAVPFTSTHGGQTFTAGPNTMNGDQALGFVRERYAFADGDYQRVRNQQAFLKAVLAKTISTDTLTNPAKIADVVAALSPYVSVDKDLNAGTVAALGLELNGVRQQNITMFTLPTAGIGTSTDGQSIVLPDSGAIAEISSALAQNKLSDYVAANKLEKGN